MNTLVDGKCYCCGNNMTVYQIIPENRWTMSKIDADEMSQWIFETVEPGALQTPNRFREQGYAIIVAGEDFGCGSKSVEHPMAALKGAGVRLVIAESFSRYSYRNAVNLGLPVLTCPGISSTINRDDTLSVNLRTGEILNRTTGKQYQADGLSDFAFAIISAGGLLPYLMQEDKTNE